MGNIVTWKAIADEVGVHVRTVKRWHYEIKRIPLEKPGNGKVMVGEKKLKAWLQVIAKKMKMPRV